MSKPLAALGLCAALALPALSSCLAAAAAVAAVGYVQYDKNGAFRDFHAPMEEVWDAAVAAVHATGVQIPEAARLGATEGAIDTQELDVRVERHPEGFVRVRVRYGTFDTEDHRRKARLLLNDVAARLGATSAE